MDSYKDLWHRGTDLSPAGIKRHHWLLLHFISSASSKQGQQLSQQAGAARVARVWWWKSQQTYHGRVWIIVMKSPVLIQRTSCLNNPKESRISHNPGCAGWGETRPWMQTHSAVSARLLVCSLLKFRVQAFVHNPGEKYEFATASNNENVVVVIFAVAPTNLKRLLCINTAVLWQGGEMFGWKVKHRRKWQQDDRRRQNGDLTVALENNLQKFIWWCQNQRRTNNGCLPGSFWAACITVM